MKNTLLLVLAMLTTAYLGAQTVVFSEDFEGSSYNVTSSSTGTGQWGVTSDYHSQGTKSDTCVITMGDTTYLTTDAFSTTGKSYVMLEFAQICKIEFFDRAYIEVSDNNGTTWTKLTATQYLGSGQFSNFANTFNEASYPTDWAPNTNTVPSNTWWKSEIFDISTIAGNKSQVKVRFVLADYNGSGSSGRYGWLLDNIKVTAAVSELIPPTITLTNPVLEDSAFSTGPFIISANITDASGIDTAMLIYSRNGGAEDTVGMTHAASLYQGKIDTVPAFSVGDTVCYRVVAIDGSAASNKTSNPSIGCKQFKIYTAPPPPGCTNPITTFPMLQDFESVTPGGGYPSNPGTLPTGWSRVPSSGNSSYMILSKTGTTSTTNTGPPGDHTTGNGKYVYGEASYGATGAVAYLQSPCMNITNLSSPQLEFWYNMYGSAVGSLTVKMWYGNQWINIWTMSGNQGPAWHKAIISLIPYKSITQFRFVTTRGGTYGDIAIDDIKVWVPPANDAGVVSLDYPTSPALTGTLPIKVGISNFGSANLTSVNVNWSVNGQTQTPFSWSGTLGPLMTMDSLQIGTYSFTAGAPTMKFWTSSPNGSVDGMPSNDTLTTSIVVCNGYLHGTYTVGTPTSDFATIGDAVTAINSCGIDSAVVFNVAAGTYINHLEFGTINGASATNTITFKGQGASTVIKYPTTAAIRPVVLFNGGKHIILDSLKITLDGTPTYGYTIQVMNNSDSNIVRNCILSAPQTTSSNINAVIFSSSLSSPYQSCNTGHFRFENNKVSGGYYGFSLRSSNPGAEGNILINNEISGYRVYAVYSYYQTGLQLIGNYIHGIYNTGGYGVYSYSGKSIKFIGNRIIMNGSSYNYGLYLYRTNYNVSNADTAIIANNMISIIAGTSSCRGIYSSYCQKQKIAFNNVYVAAGSSNTSGAIYLANTTGGSDYVYNNNLVNVGGGYAYYVSGSATAYIKGSDYNNLYVTGTYIGYWGTQQTNLASWKLASGKDAHSVSTNPGYLSNVDLHTNAVGIFAKGKSMYEVPDDFDGETRDSIPCIGADEFLVVIYDAGVSQIISPSVVCPGDTANIIVEIKNYGLDTLTSATIGWSVNDTNKATTSYTGSLLPGNTDTVLIGTYLFNSSTSYNLKFWTSMPNNVVDLQPANDTSYLNNFKTAIPAGTYTVGGTGADYPTIADMTQALSDYGICGPVVFKINSGTYSARLALNTISGASASNTITITSATGDSSDVIINYNTSTSDPAIISINNSPYITISSITFNCVGSVGRGVALWGNTHHCNFTNNVFNLPNASAVDVAGLYINNNAAAQYINFSKNRVAGGGTGVYARGASQTSPGKAIFIDSNIFTFWRYYGVYLYYQDSVMIRYNHFSDGTSATTPRGIYAYYCDGAKEIIGNTIELTPSSYGYGIYMYYNDGASNAKAIIANNMISITTGSTSSTDYGIYMYNSKYQRILYNSINVIAGGQYTRGLYISSGNNNEVVNNILRVPNGITYYVVSGYAINISDYNDFYSNATKFAYWQGYKGNLTALKAASGKDAHSMDVDPNYYSNTNLHLITSPLNGKGTAVANVTTDIDGDTRSTTAPDMGADEFDPPAWDITLIDVTAPENGCGMTNVDVTARVRNTGMDTIVNTLVLKYTLDSGATYVSENVTATIYPQDTFAYTFSTQANLTSSVDKNFAIWVVGVLPQDPIPFNDTAKKVVFNGVIPPMPTVTNTSTTYGSTATITASSTNMILWYDSLNASLPLGIGTSYTTGQLFDTTVFYAVAKANNGCYSAFAPLTVNVTGIPAGDVGISELLVNEGCGNDTNELISIRVYNQGYAAVNGGVNATFRVDSNAWVSMESITDTIYPNDTITYTFTATANLKNLYGPDTSFSIESYIVLTGDPYHPNDSIVKSPVISKYTPDNPVVSSPLMVPYGNVAHLTATSVDSLMWFKTLLDSLPFAMGSSVYTSPLYWDTTYYVQAGSSGGSDSIATIFTAGNGQNGNMFNVVATNTVTIDSFIISPQSTGNLTVEVYYRQGTYIGYETNSSAWTMLGSKTVTVTSGGSGSKLTVPIGGLTIPAGQTYGLYVTFTSGNMNYSNGNGSNQTFSDANMTLNLGVGKSYPFGGTFNPRVWNGQIYYSLGGGSGDCRSDKVSLFVDVGAQPPIDAGMYAVINPPFKVPSNVPTPVQVSIKNFGTDTLQSVNITYQIDGAVKNTYAWTGNILSNDTSAAITIYTDTFSGGPHHMRVWVSSANGTNNGVNANDTLDYYFSACLNGVYTVGDSTSDFPTFQSALSALDSAGICGHVIFDVKPGTYNLQIPLQPVTGMDSANTVTFRSFTGDSTDVIIQNAASAANLDYVVVFYGSSYYKLQKLTIKATGTQWARAIVFYNGSKYNTVENCVIESFAGYLYNSTPVYFYNTGSNSYNILKNNHLKNGYYGINAYGNTSYLNRGNQIIDNTIENFYSYGIYAYYQDSLYVHGNKILTGTNTNSYGYGAYFYRCRNKLVFDANDIQMATSSSSYGLRLYYVQPQNIANTALVSNNFISIQSGSGSNYGTYIYGSNRVNFYNNSVYLSGGGTGSRGFYISSGSNNSVINNIFSATQGGYAYYVSSPNSIATSDYNDIYATGGSNYAYWSGARANLSALKTASGKDAHSKEIDPYFFSITDLHCGSVDLNGAGYSLSDVPYDIDGDARNATHPDIGADEFTPPPNDAAIIAVKAPVSPVSTGSNNVHVDMRNFGADTLVSASIAWEANSVPQSSYSWTGSLPTGATADSINIGSYNFPVGSTVLKIWPENPNAGVDGNHANDTLEVTLVSCNGPLHGTYTVGGTNPDYPNIAAAALAVQSCGVDSHVVFNIYPGIYNGQIELGQIAGSADTATVTFQSSTGDSTDVILTHTGSAGSANFVVYLNGTDYVRFKHMTIEGHGTGIHVIEIKGGANHNVFYGNIIKADNNSNGTIVINSSSDDDEFNTLKYNVIKNGYYGIYLRGLSSANGESSIVIDNNIIRDFGSYGLYAYYMDSIKVRNNIVSSSSGTYLYGLYFYYANNGFDISGNKVELNPNYSAYGIRLYYSWCNATHHGLLYNNFVMHTSGSSSQYGFYVYNSRYIDVVFNNVMISSGYSYSRDLYISSGNNIRVLNNNLVNSIGAYAYYVTSPSVVTQSDHNNYYVTGGGNFAYWGGAKSSLSALQMANSMDSNSVSVDPGYYSNTDLHITNVVLNAAGTPIAGVTTDIDGDARPANPDIGADEFTPQQWDAAVVSLNLPKQTYGPEGSTQHVFARVRNFGTDTITSMSVGYVYNNGSKVTQTWTGTLLPGDTSSILFATAFTTIAGDKDLETFTMLTSDGDMSNDTLKIVYTGLPLVTPTYCDGFDGQNIWVPLSSEWQRGVPQGNSINTAHSAPNVWMTGLSANYSTNVDEYLLSPFFDFSNVNTGSTLKFWRNNVFGSGDGFNVEYSTDGGNSWVTLGFMGDTAGTNWYNNQVGGMHMFMGSSSGWVLSSYNLSLFNQSQNPVQLRFHLHSNTSGTNEGVAIDDLCIQRPPIPNDVGVISIDAPADSTTIGSTNTVTVTVKNFGTATQTSIPVNYEINGAGTITETMSVAGGLMPDSTAQFSFNTTFTGPGSDYNLCAYTTLTGDVYTNNDESCTSMRSTAAALDAGVIAILTPKDTASYGKNVVKIRFKNYGTTPLTSCKVSYYINTASNKVTETWTGPALNYGDSVEYTFTQTYNSPYGIYQVCAMTELTNDADLTNNSICKSVVASGFDELPEIGMKLWQNIPNPASGETMIAYEIPKAGKIRMEIVDVLGHRVMLVEEKAIAGRHQLKIDANKLSAGVYYYTLEYDGYRLTKKMIVNP